MNNEEWRGGLVTFEDVLRDRLDDLRERKRRLFLCGCLRQAWPVLADVSQQAVEMTELFVDGGVSVHELDRAWWRCYELFFLGVQTLADRATLVAGGDLKHLTGDAIVCVCEQIREALLYEASRKVASGLLPEDDLRVLLKSAHQAQNALFHDVFGDLDERHVIEPDWLLWDAGVVVELARGIYDEHRWLEMTVLGDALEEAGCTDDDLIDHCHQRGPHTRGCWVLDLVLGRT